MELRAYQYALINDLYKSWDSGATNVCMQLATGGGKTVIFSHVIAAHAGASIAVAHRVELIYQISLTLSRYKIRHNIMAQPSAIREIISMQMKEFGARFYDSNAKCTIASVDTLIRMDAHTPWFKDITLVIQDEGHHPLKNNKWGKVAALFTNARGLYPTATPCRADGQGLGSHADGILDALIQGPRMRDLIDAGHLTDYRIFAPPSDLDLSSVPIAASGDYSNPKLRQAVHKSCIVGDIVEHYVKIAPGKLGVTFTVDVEAATKTAAAFRAKGVAAEVMSAKTPPLLRAEIMRNFREGKIKQLVNVDILGEGVDVPAIEVVSFARPTQSYGLYSQQFGRALRPMPDKKHAIIIDHVNNVQTHGLPDSPRVWSLDRREKRTRSVKPDVMPVTTCLNTECFAVYEAFQKACPYCGHVIVPMSRTAPKFVAGDLHELDLNTLRALRAEIDRVTGHARIPHGLSVPAEISLKKKHEKRKSAQILLRQSIAQWAGFYKEKYEDSIIYRIFYFTFGVDIGTAQTLSAAEAEKLKNNIDETVNNKLL